MQHRCLQRGSALGLQPSCMHSQRDDGYRGRSRPAGPSVLRSRSSQRVGGASVIDSSRRGQQLCASKQDGPQVKTIHRLDGARWRSSRCRTVTIAQGKLQNGFKIGVEAGVAAHGEQAVLSPALTSCTKRGACQSAPRHLHEQFKEHVNAYQSRSL